VVKLLDSSGNVVTGYAGGQIVSKLFDLTVTDIPSSSVIQRVDGGAAVTETNGVANFNGLKVIGVPSDTSNYKLSFSLTGVSNIAPTLSEGFHVMHGAVASIVVVQAPVAGQQSGETFLTPAKVAMKDQYGNVVTSANTDYIDASIVSGTDSVLNNKHLVKVTNGIATFADLTLAGKIDQTYSMKFSLQGTAYETDPANPDFPTNNLHVIAGDPYQLKVVTQAVARETGQELSTMPVVAVEDQWGNPVTTHAPITIVMGVTPGNGANAGQLEFRDDLGNLLPNGNKITIANGIASFQHVTLIGKPGVGYALTFDVEGSTGIASTATNAFRVTAAAPNRIEVTTPIMVASPVRI
jgi:hypothetical protein